MHNQPAHCLSTGVST